MGRSERDFMKDIIGILREKYSGCRNRSILVLTRCTSSKILQHEDEANKWIEEQNENANSSIRYFLDTMKLETSDAPSRIIFVDNKVPDPDLEEHSKPFMNLD